MGSAEEGMKFTGIPILDLDSLSDASATIYALRDGKVQHRLSLVRDGVEAMEFLFGRA
jgi:hypothetical protein